MSVFDDLLDKWNTQQRIFMQYRELRAEIMAKVINTLKPVEGRPVRILDLGCGPGSLSHHMLRLVPGCEVVGVDCDPMLLRIAAETNPDQDRFHIVDVNLSNPDWTKALPVNEFDAVISATALHWLSLPDLVQVYKAAVGLIRPGGVVLNADHMYYSVEDKPTLQYFADTFRDAYKAQALAAGAQDWDEWWDEARAIPELADEVVAHRERWAQRHESPHIGPQFHIQTLKAVGCIEADVIWRDFDDIVLCGVLPT